MTLAPYDPTDVPHLSSTLRTATNQTQGTYDPFRCVISLTKDNYDLTHPPAGMLSEPAPSKADLIRANGTYLHETTHWWQFMGSASGLLYSLSHAATTLSSAGLLRNVAQEFGPHKSLLRWTDSVLQSEGDSAQPKLAKANVAANNAFDLYGYQVFAMGPPAQIEALARDPHFHSVGHSFFIAYSRLLELVKSITQSVPEGFPTPDILEDCLWRLERERVDNFFAGSPPPSRAISDMDVFEGQSRFTEIQYLNELHGGNKSFRDFHETGYLGPAYTNAFDVFLCLSGSTWPQQVRDPLVSLFLLVCNIAINPTRGFPFDVECPGTFVSDVDVVSRFEDLCGAVQRWPSMQRAITKHSREEYAEIGCTLSAGAGLDSPIRALEKIVCWADVHSPLAPLMDAHRSFRFGSQNVPVRVLFSHFLSFSRDRLSRPEFFCWPGRFLGSESAEEVRGLWLRHLSLFSRVPGKSGVYPRDHPTRELENVQGTFLNFFEYVAFFDLTKQWILEDGPFDLDFEWLFHNYSREVGERYADDILSTAYGVKVRDFHTVSP